MQSFFSDPGGVGREIALRSLRKDIVGLIGGPVKIHDAVFVDAPLADFFVTERHRELYAIRWLESADFPAGLTRTLGAYVRMQETGRDELIRMLDLPDDFPPATLILVSDRIEDDWIRAVSTLRIPVILLRAHSLVDGTRHSAGCLFEKCYASRSPTEIRSVKAPSHVPSQKATAREPEPREEDADTAPPQVNRAAPTREDDVASAPAAESHAARYLENLSRSSQSDPEETGMGADVAKVESPGDQGEEASLPADETSGEPSGFSKNPAGPGDETSADAGASPPPDRDDPVRQLSDEELATFRLLENVLEATRSR